MCPLQKEEFLTKFINDSELIASIDYLKASLKCLKDSHINWFPFKSTHYVIINIIMGGQISNYLKWCIYYEISTDYNYRIVSLFRFASLTYICNISFCNLRLQANIIFYYVFF